MRAAIFNEPRNVTAGDRPDATIRHPSDAVVRVLLSCVCGSDLWYYRGEIRFRRDPSDTSSLASSRTWELRSRTSAAVTW
jgi:threonine dehydrogenase-like Zn-dependent dehydrogenase